MEKQTKSLKTKMKQHLKNWFSQTGADNLRFQDLSANLQRYFTDLLGSHDEQDCVVITREREAYHIFIGKFLWCGAAPTCGFVCSFRLLRFVSFRLFRQKKFLSKRPSL